MFDFWYELPPILRALMGVAMMGVSVAIYFASGGHAIAYGLGIMGLIFLIFSGAGGNSGGYKF